ncbi:hypothetical protein FF2_039358 [Malus domestica]
MARIIGFTAEGMLAKAASLAAEPLVRSWGLEAKLTELHQTLSLIQAITRDAADAVWVEKLQDVANDADDADAVWVEKLQDVANDADADAVWVEKLQDVANDADDVLEDINYEVLRHKLQIQNLLKRKVLNFISLSNPVAFRLKVAHQLKKINASLVDLKNRAPVRELVSAPSQAMGSIRETNSSIGDEIIVGRDEAVSNILATLTSSEVNQENLSVMAIVGMPGLGKTIRASYLYMFS